MTFFFFFFGRRGGDGGKGQGSGDFQMKSLWPCQAFQIFTIKALFKSHTAVA